MPVVTMTGTLGSGAREVGRAAADLLGVDFVDQQLMVRAAQRCGVPVGSVAEHDERAVGLGQRLTAIINTFLERSAAASGADPLTGASGLEGILSRSYADLAAEEEEPHISGALYQETMSTIIRELAAGGAIVILGRGSQMILDDMPGATHVLCIAPAELRAYRIAEREDIGLDEAKRRCTDGDRARAAFYKKFWKVDVDDAGLYDLTINTDRMPFDLAAEVVATTAKQRAATA
jgi:cytidylate kinase